MSNQCQLLHESSDSCKRIRFPYDSEKIPLDGIYLLFELGERGHGYDRIVRVGTHTGLHKLPSRLTEHFMVENKDRSIFRKNIGRALLAKEDDPFLDDWELDLTKKEERDLHSERIDEQRQAEVERQVSSYIQDSFSFSVLPISGKEKRLKLESRIISTVSLCDECEGSTDWLGRNSPKEKIRRSGLWLIQGLYKEPLSDDEMKYLDEIVGGNRGH